MTAADLVVQGLAHENADLRETNAALIDVIADLTWQNVLLASVADYRLRHNSNLLDTLARAAKPQRRAA